LRPWLVRIEKSITKNLLASERQNYFSEFKIDGLLRGDSKSRAEFYASAIQNVWMNPNEVRALENMDPRDGGEVYENPNVKTKQDGTNGETNI
jgi:HK97 family phage portal protein